MESEKLFSLRQKPQCIPKDQIDPVVSGMYLNILEYVPKEKQDKLIEMINMEEKCEGLIASIVREGLELGYYPEFNERLAQEYEWGAFENEKKHVISLFNAGFSISEISRMLEVPLSRVKEITENLD